MFRLILLKGGVSNGVLYLLKKGFEAACVIFVIVKNNTRIINNCLIRYCN